jgi:hypothetical protein
VAFPTIPLAADGRVTYGVQANATATRSFPNLNTLAGKATGDLLIAIVFAYQASGTNATFGSWTAGWQEFVDRGTSGSTMAVGAAYKWCTGQSEAGVVTCVQAGSPIGHATMLILAIPGAHATSPPEGSTIATGTSTIANAPALTPTWGADDTLWIAVAGGGETSTTGSFTGVTNATPPTNYSSPADTGISQDVASSPNYGCDGAVAFQQLNAASEDPGAWTGVDVGAARNCALVIAVRPAPAAEVSNAAGDVHLRKMTVAAEGTGTSETKAGGVQVNFDTVGPSATGIHSNGSPITWAHVNNHNCVIVAFTNSNAASNPVTAVTYGGVTLPFLDYIQGANPNGGTALYGKVGGLPQGSNTVSVSFTTGSGDMLACSVSPDADVESLGTPFTKTNPTSGSNNISGSVPDTHTGGLIVAAAGYGGGSGGGSFSGTNGVTVRVSDIAGAASPMDNQVLGTVASTGGGAAQTVGFSHSSGNDWWTMIAVEILGVSTPGFNVTMKKMIFAAEITATAGEESEVSGGPSLKKMTITGVSTETSSASNGPRMKKMKAAASLVATSSASGDPRMKKMRAAGSSTETSSATGDLRLRKMSVSGSVTITPELASATGDIRLKKMTVAGASTEVSAVSGGPRMKKIIVAGASTEVSDVSGGSRLKKMRVSGSSDETSAAASTLSLRKMKVAGDVEAGTTDVSDVTGAVGLKKMRVAGSVTGTSSATGSSRLKKMRIAGSSTETSSATGALRLRKMGIAADVSVQAETSSASGDIRLRKMRVAGSSTEVSVLSGGSALKKMKVSGSVTETSALSGAVLLKKMSIAGSSEETSDLSGQMVLRKMQVSGSITEFREPVHADPMFVYSLL